MSFYLQRQASAVPVPWAQRPSAAAAGALFRITDFGRAPGMVMQWDGARLMRESFYVLPMAQPFLIAPSGTMGADGALVLGTALPRIIRQAWVYFPAGAVFTGSPVGWYYTEFASTTIGTVFADTYTTGLPDFPSAGVAVTGPGPGAFAGVVGSVTGPSITVPGGMLSTGSRVRQVWSIEPNSTAGTKNMRSTVAGTVVTTLSVTTAGLRTWVEYVLRDATGLTMDFQSSGSSSTGLGTVTLNNLTPYNPAASIDFAATLQNNLATDVVVLNYWTLELLP